MFVLQPRLHRVCQIACVQFVRYINNQSKNSVTLDRDKVSDAGQLVCVRRCWPPHRTKRLRSYGSNFVEKRLMDAWIIAQKLVLNCPVQFSSALFAREHERECEKIKLSAAQWLRDQILAHWAVL